MRTNLGQDYLPSRWSDFSFFSNLVRDRQEMLEGLKQFWLCQRDSRVIRAVWNGGIGCLGSVLAEAAGFAAKPSVFLAIVSAYRYNRDRRE